MELNYSGSYFPFIQDEWQDKDKGNLTLSIGIKAPLADFGGMYRFVGDFVFGDSDPGLQTKFAVWDLSKNYMDFEQRAVILVLRKF